MELAERQSAQSPDLGGMTTANEKPMPCRERALLLLLRELLERWDEHAEASIRSGDERSGVTWAGAADELRGLLNRASRTPG
jgi:hypothetical protein